MKKKRKHWLFRVVVHEDGRPIGSGTTYGTAATMKEAEKRAMRYARETAIYKPRVVLVERVADLRW